MENETPLWIQLLPDCMKGGPKSQYQQKMKAAAEVSNVMAPIASNPIASTPAMPMSSGGSVHTSKFKHLAEKLKGEGKGKAAFPIAMHALGYEKSVLESHRRKPGYEIGGYTGDSGNKVVADKVANTKQFVDHEGEYYVNAPVVGVLGGPEGVKKLVEEAAQKKVREAEMGMPTTRPSLPIVALGDQERRQGFLNGGSVLEPENELPSLRAGRTNQYPTSSMVQKEPENESPSLFASRTNQYPDTSGMAVKEPENELPSLFASRSTNQLAGGSTPTGLTPILSMPNTQSMTREESLTFDPLLFNNQGSVKLPGDQPISSSTISTMRDENLKYNVPLSIEAASVDGTAEGSGAKTPISGARDVRTGLDFLRSATAGENKVLDSIINQTLQKHGANTAAGKAELQMRLGQQGVTGPALDAALETYDRNARVGRSQIETSLTQQGMEQAQTAAGQLLTAGQAERSFDMNQRQSQMKTALDTGNFQEYARIYKETYGTDVNVAGMQDAFTIRKIDDATASIYDDIAAGLDMTNPGTAMKVKNLWTALGNQGEPPAGWVDDRFTTMRDTTNPYEQYKKSMTDEQIVNTFFSGDQGELDLFAYGGETGTKAFAKYLPYMMQSGGVKWTQTPGGGYTYTIDWDNPAITGFINPKGPGKISTDFKPGTDYTIGSKMGDMTVTAIDGQSRPTTGTEDGQRYTISYDKDGRAITTKSNETSTGDGPVIVGGKEIVYNGKPVERKMVNGEPKLYSDGVEVTASEDWTQIKPAGTAPLKAGDPMTFGGTQATHPSATGTIKFVSNVANGQLGQDDGTGKYFIMTSSGSTVPYTVKDLISAPAAVDQEKVLSGMLNTDTTKDYFASLGSTNQPDAFVFDKLLGLGDDNAIQYALANPTIYTKIAQYPKVAATIDKIADQAEPSVSGSRYTVSQKDVPDRGTFYVKDGVRYYVKSVAPSSETDYHNFGGLTLFKYPATLINLSTGAETTLDVYAP